MNPFGFDAAVFSGTTAELDGPSLSQGGRPLGTVALHLVDTTRTAPQERYPQEVGANRKLMVQIWYPADSVENLPLNRYIPDYQVIEALAPETAWDSSYIQRLQSHSHLGAQVSNQQTSYPVLLFSHGLGGTRFQNTALLEELAKSGYVVVSIDHTHGSGATVFPDGKMAPFADQVDGRRRAQIWGADIRFVLNELDELNLQDPSGLLTQRLNLTNIGAFGHSAGGAAVAEAARQDPRIKAGANLDGTPFGDVVSTGLDQPFMTMTNPESVSFRIRRFQEQVRGDAYLVALEGADHMSFTDLPLLPAPTASNKRTLDGPRGLQITADYVKAFFDKHLLGIQQPLMDGPSAEHPEASFKHRAAGTPDTRSWGRRLLDSLLMMVDRLLVG